MARLKAKQASEIGNLQMMVGLLQEILEAQRKTNELLAAVAAKG